MHKSVRSNLDSFQKLMDLQDRQPRRLQGSNHGADSSVYQVVLNHIWNSRFSAAADLASETIANFDDDTSSDEQEQLTMQLYRAWIEALVNLEDRDSLSYLANHLLLLGQEQSEKHSVQKYNLLGLRGIIHAELDQAPAVRLMIRSLSSHNESYYVLEFLQICARRGLSDSDFIITNATSKIADYFTWNTLAQDLASEGHRNELNQCLKYISKCYPGSPTSNFIEYHLACEHSDWSAARDFANRLNQSFNLNSDYCFYAAHAAYKMNDFTSAISIIESAPKNLAETDVDCASLLGESYAARALSLESDEDARKAVTQLTNATKLMRRYGLEVGPSLSLIKRMEDRVGGSTVPDYSGNQFREPRSWLVMLSPRRADELVQSRDSLIEELHRPMGVEAAPGDVVLFASRSAHLSKKMTGTKQEWRVLAMYRVTSRPYWHPTQRWQSALELIDRPEHPIPIDAQELKSDISIRGKRNALPKGHHARYEVYKLDESAMDIMIAAVKRRSDGIHHDVERRNIGQNAKKPG